MTELFIKLLDRSLSASWIILAVIAARFLLKKAPKAMRCALWALVAVRLICPISFQSTVSLMPEAQTISQEALTEPVAYAIPGEGIGLIPEIAPAASGEAAAMETTSDYSYPDIPRKIGTPVTTNVVALSRLDIFSTLWCIGVVLMLAYALFSYSQLHRKVQASIHVSSNVYLCDYIDSPFILGIFRPRIYLSSAMHPEDAPHVLAHERAHLKRRDHWWKPLGFLLLCVYWFHPLVWAAYILLCRDIELACDERVVKDLGIPEKKAYSEALLNCSVPRRMIAACPLAFGEVGVRERVKSVLHYKKPGFWLILLAVIIVLVVAVCFLTDPASHTLSNLAKIQEDEIVCIDLRTEKGHNCLDSQREITTALEFLETAKYNPEPISQERREETVDEYGWLYPYIAVNYAETTLTYYFTYDYSEVWCNDGGEISYPYPVQDPQAVLAFVTEQNAYIKNKSASGEPFATINDPWQWTQNIQLDVVRQVSLRKLWAVSSTTTQSTNGNLSTSRFQELLTILHAIPEEALTPAGSTNHNTSRKAVVEIADAANDLAVYICCYGDTLELKLYENMATIWDYTVTPQGVTAWNVDSPELLAFMQEENEHPSIVQTWLSAQYNCERVPLSVSYGNAAIWAIRLTDWDYEAVEYSEETGSFGIRCRPKAVDTGWLYYSFWPDGYTAPEEEDHYLKEDSSNAYHSIISWPSAAASSDRSSIYSYSLRRYSIGDYVIINEGMDSWYPEYKETISDLWGFITFEYGQGTLYGPIRTYDNITVDFTNCDRSYNLFYYDWAAIAAELDATELLCLGAQELNDHLFAALQNGDEYAIAVFQKGDQGYYEFTEILEISSDTEVPYADYTDGSIRLCIHLLTDDTVTAYSLNGDSTTYTIPDRIPAIVVQDLSDQESWFTPTITLYRSEPLSLIFKPALTAIAFETDDTAPNPDASWKQTFLTGGSVSFCDEESATSTVTMTYEELLRLRDILLTIPSDQVERGTTNQTPRIELSLTCLDGLTENNDDWSFDLSYSNGTANLTLTRIPKSGSASYAYTIRSEALNAFLESLCNAN